MSSPRRRRGIEGLMAGEPQRERADPHLPVCLEGEVTRVDGDDLWARIRRLDGSGLREVGPCAWQRPIVSLEIGWDLADPGPPHEHDAGTVEPSGSHAHTVDVIGWRTDPPAGTRCLIAFADGRLERPWVVAFVGWPRRG
jgi:hypothetical protein